MLSVSMSRSWYVFKKKTPPDGSSQKCCFSHLFSPLFVSPLLLQLVKKKVPLKCMDEVNENSSQNRFVSASPAQLRLEPLYVARAAFETAFLAVH